MLYCLVAAVLRCACTVLTLCCWTVCRSALSHDTSDALFSRGTAVAAVARPAFYAPPAADELFPGAGRPPLVVVRKAAGLARVLPRGASLEQQPGRLLRAGM